MENVGLQLWSVKEEMAKNLLGALEKVAEMGYQGVQFAGFFNQSSKDVKEKMDELGIHPTGAHVSYDLLHNELDQTMKYHEEIGNDTIILPWVPEEMRSNADDYARLAEFLEKTGKALYARGFTFGYHNHDFEFAVYNGSSGLDIIFENTDSNHLKMELDCFWAAYTGNDPIEVIEKYKERCISLHIKDMKKTNRGAVSTELGTGILPLANYMKKGKEVGARMFIVEQEHFTKDPLDCAQINFKKIKQLHEQSR